jgi:hypothetical protein
MKRTFETLEIGKEEETVNVWEEALVEDTQWLILSLLDPLTLWLFSVTSKRNRRQGKTRLQDIALAKKNKALDVSEWMNHKHFWTRIAIHASSPHLIDWALTVWPFNKDMDLRNWGGSVEQHGARNTTLSCALRIREVCGMSEETFGGYAVQYSNVNLILHLRPFLSLRSHRMAVQHAVWKIDDEAVIVLLRNGFPILAETLQTIASRCYVNVLEEALLRTSFDTTCDSISIGCALGNVIRLNVKSPLETLAVLDKIMSIQCYTTPRLNYIKETVLERNDSHITQWWNKHWEDDSELRHLCI